MASIEHSMAVSEASTFAMAASLLARPSRSMRRAASWVRRRDALTAMAIRASFSLTAWCWPIALPKASRSLAYRVAASSAARAMPTLAAAM